MSTGEEIAVERLRSIVLAPDEDIEIPNIFAFHRGVIMAKALEKVVFEPPEAIERKGHIDGNAFALERVNAFLFLMGIPNPSFMEQKLEAQNFLIANGVMFCSQQEIAAVLANGQDPDQQKFSSKAFFPRIVLRSELRSQIMDMIPGREIYKKENYVFEAMKNFVISAKLVANANVVKDDSWFEILRVLLNYLREKMKEHADRRLQNARIYETAFNQGFEMVKNYSMLFYQMGGFQQFANLMALGIEHGRKVDNLSTQPDLLNPYPIPFTDESFPPDFRRVIVLPDRFITGDPNIPQHPAPV